MASKGEQTNLSTDVIRFGVEQSYLLFKPSSVRKVQQRKSFNTNDLYKMSIVSVSVVFVEPYLSRILTKPVFDVRALQEYIFICCQRQSGGLIDKPDT